MEPYADTGVAQRRIVRPLRLHRHAAFAEIVGELCDVGAAIRVETTQLLVDARAPEVLGGQVAAEVLADRLGHEHHAHARGRKTWVADGGELPVACREHVARDDRDLRDPLERSRIRGHGLADATASERMELARDQRYPQHARDV